MIYFLDTSAILNGALAEYPEVWITPLVINELDNIKNSNKPEHTKYLARQAVRDIVSLNRAYIYYPSQKRMTKFFKKHDFLEDKNDHKLLAAASLLQEDKDDTVFFVTSDNALFSFSKIIFNLDSLFFQKKEEPVQEEYCGWKKFTPNENELVCLYSEPNINVLNAKINEYCEIFENEELKDVLTWDGKQYRTLKYKDFTSALGEKIKPRNLEQKMYLDLLQNKNVPVKLCVAKFGTGKSYLALNYALHEIQQGKFERLIFVKNNLEVKGAGVLGTLPGDEIAKQYPWLRQIEDHIGIQKFEEYLETGVIEPAHLSTLRGRDLKNCIILVDEAENLLAKNIQLLIGRVAENSEIIFCADLKQCDYPDEKMSGISKMIERFAGQPLFGMVKLLKTERSDVSAMADLMD